MYAIEGDYIAMGEQGEQVADSRELTHRLQAEFEFRMDDTGEWLMHDEFAQSNGIDGHEWLPCRTRVSTDGRKLEFGARKEDIERTLMLAKIAGDNAQDIDHIRNFWPNDSRITLAEDDEWLFIGTAIEPTPRGFETDMQGASFGLDVALTAAVKGMTYEEMKSHDWFDAFVATAEAKKPSGGYTSLFAEAPSEDDTPDEDYEDDDSTEEDDQDTENDRWDRQAPNLSAHRIDSYNKSVSYAPTVLRIGDKIVEGNNGWLIAHNGTDDVTIYDSWYEPTEDKKGSTWNHYTVKLPIPEGVDVTTVSDMTKLTHVEFAIRYDGTREPTVTTHKVQVVVDEHAVRMSSADGTFAFEVKEPCCAECQTPIWKFREPTKEEWAKEDDPLTNEIILPRGMSRGGGVYHFTLGEDRSNRNMYCYDDCMRLEEEFAQEFPFARRENALAAVRKRLDEEGYSDVQLMAEQTWPVWPGTGTGLELFAYVEYERNGRKIMRRAGTPRITYDGQIDTSSLPSREYIEFR
jgi:hypothetical protein